MYSSTNVLCESLNVELLDEISLNVDESLIPNAFALDSSELRTRSSCKMFGRLCGCFLFLILLILFQ